MDRTIHLSQNRADNDAFAPASIAPFSLSLTKSALGGNYNLREVRRSEHPSPNLRKLEVDYHTSEDQFQRET